MRVIIGVLMAMLLAGPAYSQMPSINLLPEKKPLTPQEEERQKEIDQAYKNATKKIPDQKAASDPWGSMRDTGGSQANPRANSGPARAR
jgi:hypothetical protein